MSLCNRLKGVIGPLTHKDESNTSLGVLGVLGPLGTYVILKWVEGGHRSTYDPLGPIRMI